MMTELAAVIAFSAITNNDKVGAILFSDTIEKYLPPKKGKQNILRIIRELINITPEKQGTNLSEALIYLNNIEKKRSITFILSDFIALNYEQALNIAAKKHDIIGIKISDPREKNLPNVGLVKVLDAESGRERIIDTSDIKVRDAWRNHFLAQTDTFSKTFALAKSDTVSIQTDEDYIKAMQVFFKRRAKR
jgi:uncharacterized protein (DUF58 family)